MTLLPESAGGGVTSRSASSLLLRVAVNRWPVSVHEGGGLRQLAALAGEGGDLSAHAIAGGVRMTCWPTLFASVVGSLIVPPKGARPADYTTGHLGERQRTALHGLIESMASPLRTVQQATAGGTTHLNLQIGAPASCLCAVVTATRDAPAEARTAFDGALRSVHLDEALQSQLSSLPLLRPPPLGAICSLLRLLRALTRSVGAGTAWGSEAAAQWALSAALHSIRLAADVQVTGGSSRTEREGVLEAGLELVVSAASERRSSSNSSNGAVLVSQILEVCGPELLGALLLQPVGGGDSSGSILSPPLREQLLSLAHALLTNWWKVIGTHEPHLTVVIQMLAAGLMQPADRPAFETYLL